MRKRADYNITITNDEDRKFIEQLYIEQYQLMYASACKFAYKQQDIDDIIAETCMHLMSRIALLQALAPKQIRVYIISTIRNISMRYRARCIRDEGVFSTLDEQCVCRGESIEKGVELAAQIEHVVDAIDRLPEKERLVLRLKFGMDMKDSDIAEDAGLSQSSVRSNGQESTSRSS